MSIKVLEVSIIYEWPELEIPRRRGKRVISEYYCVISEYYSGRPGLAFFLTVLGPVSGA